MMTVSKKAVPKELLDSLLADFRKPEDLIGENGCSSTHQVAGREGIGS